MIPNGWMDSVSVAEQFIEWIKGKSTPSEWSRQRGARGIIMDELMGRLFDDVRWPTQTGVNYGHYQGRAMGLFGGCADRVRALHTVARTGRACVRSARALRGAPGTAEL